MCVIISFFFFLHIKRVLAKGQQKYVKNNNIPPVKRTEGGPVNIRDGQTERKTVTKFTSVHSCSSYHLYLVC